MDVQTTLGYGYPHYSAGHENHRFGSSDPVQQDFGFYNPNSGRFTGLVGVGVQPGQMTLDQFGVGCSMQPADLRRPI